MTSFVSTCLARRMRVLAVVALVLAGLSGHGLRPAPARVLLAGTPDVVSDIDRARTLSNIAAVPLHFEVNRGQASDVFDYVASGAGYKVGLGAGGATLVLSGAAGDEAAVVGMTLLGADSAASGRPLDTLPGTVGYYRGNDPARWQPEVSTHARVQYRGVYEGIDVVYYGNQRRLQYDFHVAPGADPAHIALGFEGADALSVGGDGQLVIRVGDRTIEQPRPYTYQVIDGVRHDVESAFALSGATVGFTVGDYDPMHPLVIDPVIAYASWFGGSGEDGVIALAVDADGSVVVYGFSHDLQATLQFPTTPGAFKPTRGADMDAFVAKFNAAGSALIYSTLLGGSGHENFGAYNYIGDMAMDAAGNVYVTGTTRSNDFPTPNGFDQDYNDDDPGATGTEDGFYAKLSPTGALLYGTYLGGRRIDNAYGIDVDAAGNVYIVGSTDSDEGVGPNGGFPIVGNAYDGTINGSRDLFLQRYNAAGVLTYSTYIGGSGQEAGTAASVKASRTTPDVVYIASDTTSSTFPTTAATRFQAFSTGTEAVLLRLNLALAPASQVTYGTFYGGNGSDRFIGLALDAADRVYVTGVSNSSEATLPSAVRAPGSPAASGEDVIVAKFDTAASGAASLVYGMRLNGQYTDRGVDIALDSLNQAWVGVSSGSLSPSGSALDFPLKNTLETTRSGNGQHGVIVAINAAGNDIVLSSLIGGDSSSLSPVAVAISSADEVWVGSNSGGGSSALGVLSPFQATFGGGDGDATLQRIGKQADLTITKTVDKPYPQVTVLPGDTLVYTIVASNATGDTVSNVVVSDVLPAQVSFVSCASTAGGICGGSGQSRTITVPSLAPGQSATITLTARVNDNVLPGVVWTNTATIAANGVADPTPGNNTGGNGGANGNGGGGVPTLTDPTGDADGDGLPNGWEQQFGLNPLSNSPENGPNGDPDGDGKTNLQELQEGTHPRGFVITYLAEGATGAFFDTRLAIANPTDTQALVLTRFQRGDGTTIRDYRVVPAMSRTTIDVEGIAGLEAAEFSTLIEADVQVVADRTMTWDQDGYGSHAERGILTRTATKWYFAEGATFGNFNLFYLIQNPNDQAAQVEVTYLLPPPAAPLVRQYTVNPQSRFNIWVDNEGLTDPALAALANAELSAIIESTNGVPIIAERAMYLDQPGRPLGAGHESAGVTAPSTQWFLAEGATGDYFDLFILIANPNPTAANVQAEYLLDTGQVITRQYVVPENSRFNIWVDLEDPALANAALSTRITATNGVPIIVERSMWWPGPTSASWQEAHNSPGEVTTGTRWALAEGEVGGARETETYVLIANTSPFAGTARVTVLFEDGTAPVTRNFALPPSSRSNVAPAGDFPETQGRRFGLLVESIGATPAQIVVERAMYSNAQGVRWAAGTNALATRLP